MPRKPRRKTPASPSEVIPDYPIRSWVDPQTGLPFHTVTLRLDDGRYLAALDFAPNIRATARTKDRAELAVIKEYEHSQNGRESETEEDDDERDHELIQAGLKEPRRRWEDIKKDLMKARARVGR
jgi:hypothetical protein